MIHKNTPPRPVVLCILDGWGYREAADNNATTRAKLPVFRKYWESCSHALLDASGESVGLPKGQIGNSDVGHMNLGAGRVVLQDLPMIDRAIARQEMENNPELLEFITKLKQSGGTCQLMGLASWGGVHSHQDHIVELARVVASAGVPVAVHAFLDGRDVPPQSAAEQVAKLRGDLEKKARHSRESGNPAASVREPRDSYTADAAKMDSSFRGNDVLLSTMCGRFYAMDRDNRWDRVEQAYDLLTNGAGAKASDAVEAINASYKAGIDDEFVLPTILNAYNGMKDGDGVLFANFRADRAREILSALLEPDFSEFVRKKTICFTAALGMVEYSERLNELMSTLFKPKIINNGMGALVAAAGLKQLRIAETEKYPHVTFFFNGGREEPYLMEERIMVQSPKVATYDLAPEMSAREVTDKVVTAIDNNEFDFIVLNYANPDMVGHTGSLDAAVKALEVLDECLGRLFGALEKQGGMALVTADHGNCETMFDKTTNGPHTAHTLVRVPVMLVNAPASFSKMRDGKLADVAPTLLQIMGMQKPVEMDGESLIVG